MAKPTAYTLPGKFGFYSAYEKKRISREGAVDARNLRSPAILNRRQISEGIGELDPGAFHRWLGKKEGEPITDADIKKGLDYRGDDQAHVHRMATFAQNSRHWKHK